MQKRGHQREGKAFTHYGVNYFSLQLMAPSTTFTVLVAVLIISTLAYCSAENVYCVTPTATSCSSCPHNSTHCATLSEYAQEAELYFTSNTTMVFLPGDHTLDMNITVANVARLTMWGESSSDNIAKIVRNGSVGFSFTNMVDFNIYSLAFTSYNRSWSYIGSNSALFLQSTQYAKLVNCSFHDNLGTALTVNSTSVTLAENSKFIRNQCVCQSFSDLEVHELGCGITAVSSTLTFTGNSLFHENTQTTSSDSYCAGAIWASASSLHFNGTNTFIGNSANGKTGVGGAIYAETNSSLSFSGVSDFGHNSADSDGGGAIFTSGNVILTFNGTNNFTGNSAKFEGGAIHAQINTSLSFNGISDFGHNSAYYDGGSIFTSGNVILTFNGTNNFTGNSAYYKGGAIYAETNSSLSFSGISDFGHNSADSNDGGAIFTSGNVILTFNGTNNFTGNSADYGGGAITAVDNVVVTFSGSNIFIGNMANTGVGGAISAQSSTSLSFSGSSNFINNSAYGGGAIFSYNSSWSFNGISDFSHNSADTSGGAIYADSSVVLTFTDTSSFSNNFAPKGGAISAYFNSTLMFDGNICFTNNGNFPGYSLGGAIYLFIDSTFSITHDTTVYWENNHAKLGGAIYVVDVNVLVYCAQTDTQFITNEKCFFQLSSQNLSNNINTQLFFYNNSADDAGSVLYGGGIDHCTLTGLNSYSSGEVFDRLVHIEDDNTTSNISSDPFRVCPCDTNKQPNCGKLLEDQPMLSVYPSETLQISVVAIGQRNGIVPALIASDIRGNSRPLSYQTGQQTTKTCTTVNYTVFSQQNVTLELYANDLCRTFGDKFVLQLDINQTCPPGFSINQEKDSCVCHRTLQQYTNNCNITNGRGQITRNSDNTFWVGYNQSHGLTVYPHCPFDYCTKDTMNFTLDDLDKQCANDRSDLLCGHCKEGYNMVLGTFQCKPSKQCSNLYLLLLIPFALMGVALVFLLLVCKLTVATGALSGLLFYANIVGVNRTIFLPVESTYVLSIFISWLNLDFGIETCFYKGMDPYGKTWLQFVFPVYIWVIVGLTIFVSRYSQKFANLLGNNPVSVLATLILLSYAKILRTLITVLTSANLEYQDNHTQTVWWYDANIGYYAGKHIPLFLVAVLVFIFLFLPYTLLLFFGQWLQAISHLRLFSWVNRLKPFMDSYHAPYKAKHRYWPGLLLVLRSVLLLVFSFTPEQGANINLLAILVVAGVIYLWAWASHGVYKNWCLDALEGSFVLNLIILVGATMYINIAFLADPLKSEENELAHQLAVGYASVSIALVSFIGILAYHIFQQLRQTKLWKKMQFEKLNNKLKTKQTKDNPNNPIDDHTESINFDRLREPLLEDLTQPTHSVV